MVGLDHHLNILSPWKEKMKNSANWKPGKFIYKNSRLMTLKMNSEVSVGLWFYATLLTGFYDGNIKI